MVLVQTPIENRIVLFRNDHLPNLKYQSYGVFYLLILETIGGEQSNFSVTLFGFGYPQHKIPVP